MAASCPVAELMGVYGYRLYLSTRGCLALWMLAERLVGAFVSGLIATLHLADFVWHGWLSYPASVAGAVRVAVRPVET